MMSELGALEILELVKYPTSDVIWRFGGQIF